MSLLSAWRDRTKRDAWLLAGVVVYAAGLGLYLLRNLDKLSLWMDEGFHWLAVRGILDHGIPLFPSGHVYYKAILYCYVLAGAALLFGLTTATLRAVSVIAFAAAIPVVYLFGRKFASRTVGAAAAVLLSLSVWGLEYARVALYFAPLVLLCPLALLLFWRGYVEERRAVRPWAWVLFLALPLIHQLGVGVWFAFPALFVIRGPRRFFRRDVLAFAAGTMLFYAAIQLHEFFFWQVGYVYERTDTSLIGLFQYFFSGFSLDYFWEFERSFQLMSAVVLIGLVASVGWFAVERLRRRTGLSVTRAESDETLLHPGDELSPADGGERNPGFSASAASIWLFLNLALVLPLLMLGFFRTHVQPRYLMFLYPLFLVLFLVPLDLAARLIAGAVVWPFGGRRGRLEGNLRERAASIPDARLSAGDSGATPASLPDEGRARAAAAMPTKRDQLGAAGITRQGLATAPIESNGLSAKSLKENGPADAVRKSAAAGTVAVPSSVAAKTIAATRAANRLRTAVYLVVFAGLTAVLVQGVGWSKVESAVERTYQDRIRSDVLTRSGRLAHEDNRSTGEFVRRFLRDDDIVVAIHVVFSYIYAGRVDYWLWTGGPGTWDAWEQTPDGWRDFYVGARWLNSLEALRAVTEGNQGRRVWVITSPSIDKQDHISGDVASFIRSDPDRLAFLGRDGVSGVYVWNDGEGLFGGPHPSFEAEWMHDPPGLIEYRADASRQSCLLLDGAAGGLDSGRGRRSGDGGTFAAKLPGFFAAGRYRCTVRLAAGNEGDEAGSIGSFGANGANIAEKSARPDQLEGTPSGDVLPDGKLMTLSEEQQESALTSPLESTVRDGIPAGAGMGSPALSAERSKSLGTSSPPRAKAAEVERNETVLSIGIFLGRQAEKVRSCTIGRRDVAPGGNFQDVAFDFYLPREGRLELRFTRPGTDTLRLDSIDVKPAQGE